MESARHLVSMVNDILDMNKLETEQFVENDIPFNLAAVLNRVNTDQQMQAGKKKIDYVVDWGKIGAESYVSDGKSGLYRKTSDSNY